MGLAENVIVELFQKNYSRRNLIGMLNIPKFNVIDVSRNCPDIGSVENKPRSGWPKNKPRDHRHLERIVITNRRNLSSILLRNYIRVDRIL